MGVRRSLLALSLVLAVSLLVFLSQHTATRADNLVSPAAVATVQVGPSSSFSYIPATQTIRVGDSVDFVWSTVGITHSATSGGCPSNICASDGNWDTGQHSGTFSTSVQFHTPGRYPYYCSVHLSFMQGLIIVTTNIYLPLILR